MNAIFKREMGSYFFSPIGYAVLALFYLASGYFFTASSLTADSSSLTGTFNALFTIVAFVIPIITMRLFSEDKKQKTDQALLTAPVRLSSIVLGKYLAALTLFFFCISITLVYALIISAFTSPDWAAVSGNFIGIFLLGSALIAIGMFLSALTESQMVAAISNVAIGIFTIVMDSIISKISVKFLADILKNLSFTGHYQSFPLGMIKLEDIIFFLSVCGVFIFLTTRVFEKKRWS
ncbi:MAG: ABC transporter permease subunit [Oscillospiraceae bacterium]|jgi:ABC-2 type transport system permease protein|nr:ABC transporter permease subunit [Oscillospiraceae bacterium]